jgi:hypothetical protein
MPRTPTLTLSPRNRASQTLRKWIDTGVLAGGQPLPSERTLAKQLGVSQTVVRRVLSEMTRDSLIIDEGPGRRSVRARNDDAKVSGVEILRSTIALLTPFGEPNKDHQEPGWVEHMSMGAIVGARLAGRDVMIIHPERMADGGVDRLLAAPPLGVVVPEPSRPLPGQDLWLHRLAAAGIPVVAYGDYYWYHNRVRGYERAMCDAGLQPLSTELFTSLDSVLPALHGPLMTPWAKFDIERHQLAGHIAPLLAGSEPVDAIMLVNDGQVIVAAAALRLLGKEPGRDVLLVGYDNIYADCPERQWESAGPAATVDKCNSQIGQELVRLLVERVEGKLSPGPQRRIVPSRLVVL